MTTTIVIPLPTEEVAKQLEGGYRIKLRRLTGLALKAEATYILAVDRASATTWELDEARRHYELALTRLGKAINEFNDVARQYLWQTQTEVKGKVSKGKGRVAA